MPMAYNPGAAGAGKVEDRMVNEDEGPIMKDSADSEEDATFVDANSIRVVWWSNRGMATRVAIPWSQPRKKGRGDPSA